MFKIKRSLKKLSIINAFINRTFTYALELKSRWYILYMLHQWESKDACN